MLDMTSETQKLTISIASANIYFSLILSVVPAFLSARMRATLFRIAAIGSVSPDL